MGEQSDDQPADRVTRRPRLPDDEWGPLVTGEAVAPDPPGDEPAVPDVRPVGERAGAEPGVADETVLPEPGPGSPGWAAHAPAEVTPAEPIPAEPAAVEPPAAGSTPAEAGPIEPPRAEASPDKPPAIDIADLSDLQDRLYRACLAGLVDAAGALLEEDADRVCAVLTEWDATGASTLPALADDCWDRLALLGMAPPQRQATAILRGVLLGLETDPGRCIDAWQRSRERARPQPPWPPLPSGTEMVTALWRRGLLSAVQEYWQHVVEAYREARTPLLEGDHAETVRVLTLARSRLRGPTERIDVLAHRVAGVEPGQTGALRRPSAPPIVGAGPAADPMLDVPSEPTAAPQWLQFAPTRDPVVETAADDPAALAPATPGPATVENVTARPALGPDQNDTVASAAAPTEQVPIPPEIPPVDVPAAAALTPRATRQPTQVRPRSPVDAARMATRREVRSARKALSPAERPPREHPFLPVIFLLLVTAAALWVIYAIVYGWPPPG